ncbi:hypothetical protein [Sphingomonas sp. 3-13AW]|uniref:hypothetical protein n=1 Tax=Sphingomonas sp. 3-13AW TaxID=3050450 RepID=UPI003BB6E574
MNNRFPSILFLGLIVALLATIMNEWVFWGVMLVGGAALAVVVYKLVSRGLFTPPSVLLDEVRNKFGTNTAPDAHDERRLDEKELGRLHRISKDDQ